MKFHEVNKALSNAITRKNIVFLYYQNNPDNIENKEKVKAQRKEKAPNGLLTARHSNARLQCSDPVAEKSTSKL